MRSLLFLLVGPGLLAACSGEPERTNRDAAPGSSAGSSAAGAPSSGGSGSPQAGGSGAQAGDGGSRSPTGAPDGSISTPGPGSDAGPQTGTPDAGPPPLDPRCNGANASGHFQLEDLDRGLVAVPSGSGNYVGWRMLGHEYVRADPTAVSYNLYRDGTLIASLTDSTNHQDDGGSGGSRYAVSAVIEGYECPRSAEVTPWAREYLAIPLEPPPGGSVNGSSYAYDVATVTRSSGSVGDASPGDVDGDGQYELVVLWEPSNAQDNSRAGFTGPVYVDCYELDGTRRWRMNLGRNIRAGAHYTQLVVYDFDGDGRAEVVLRTAPGTRDGSGAFLSRGPAASDDDDADYRNGEGYVLSGPEYLTVFDGANGVELATVDFQVARGRVADWGDDYGNRVDRFLASAGFVSDLGTDGKGSGRPAILMARGYYTRATVTAWSYRDGELSLLWTADSDRPGAGALAGQGAHSMVLADVDGDDAQEIIYGAAMIDSGGSFGCATGLGHGDALHVTDLVPSRAGLEVFMPHEDTRMPLWSLRDAATCAIIHQSGSSGSDNGRGVAADIFADSSGAEMWSAADDRVRSCATGAALSQAKPRSANFLIWWDGDVLRELEDGTAIDKGDGTRLLNCSECMSNNHTKATPTLTADLFGDWREEIIWRTPDSAELRVFTTTHVTQRRIHTLMHDPQYRIQVSSEQTGYNQPPHTGFHLGDGMQAPPQPNLHVR